MNRIYGSCSPVELERLIVKLYLRSLAFMEQGEVEKAQEFLETMRMGLGLLEKHKDIRTLRATKIAQVKTEKGPKPSLRPCANCGAEFLCKTTKRKYCSLKCNHAFAYKVKQNHGAR